LCRVNAVVSEKRYAITQAMPAYAPASAPKSSTASNVDAIGVLAAPPKTAANPMAANSYAGSGISCERALPSVAPM
jgi:hypothetical protein